MILINNYERDKVVHNFDKQLQGKIVISRLVILAAVATFTNGGIFSKTRYRNRGLDVQS